MSTNSLQIEYAPTALLRENPHSEQGLRDLPLMKHQGGQSCGGRSQHQPC